MTRDVIRNVKKQSCQKQTNEEKNSSRFLKNRSSTMLEVKRHLFLRFG